MNVEIANDGPVTIGRVEMPEASLTGAGLCPAGGREAAQSATGKGASVENAGNTEVSF